MFLRDGDRVFHTYSVFARGMESIGGSYYLLDETALGRQEEWEKPAGRAANARAAVPDFSGSYRTTRPAPGASCEHVFVSEPRRPSSTPTSTPSTRRSSSATTRRCAAGRSSSAAASCSPPATRPRRSASAPRWAADRRGSCARGAVGRRAADVRVLRGEQGRVRGVRRHHAARRGHLDRRGVPRRRRPPRGSPGTPVEIADDVARATCSSEVGLPITVGVARTKFLAKVASGVAKPDGLLVVPPERELEFLHPLPVERLWGVGPVTADEAARSRHRRPSARSRGSSEASLVVDPRPCLGPPPARARAQPRPAARRGRPAAPVDRVAARARVAATAPGEIEATLAGARRPGDAADARRATASVARSCCDCASTTSRGDAFAHAGSSRPRARDRSSPRRGPARRRRCR